jgi:hypothetical protein
MGFIKKNWIEIICLPVALIIGSVLLVVIMSLAHKVELAVKSYQQEQLVEHVEENGVIVIFDNSVGGSCWSGSTDIVVEAGEEQAWFPTCMNSVTVVEDGILDLRVDGKVWFFLDSRRPISDYEIKEYRFWVKAGQEVPLLINDGSVVYATLTAI